jgi:hypothetical protein
VPIIDVTPAERVGIVPVTAAGVSGSLVAVRDVTPEVDGAVESAGDTALALVGSCAGGLPAPAQATDPMAQVTAMMVVLMSFPLM